MGSACSNLERSRSRIVGWRAIAWVLLAAVVSVTSARPSVARPAPFPLPEVERFRLPNGLDVVLERNDRQPRVAIVMSYDVGSRDDPPGYAGLAELVERLTFRRSKHLGLYAGDQLLEKAGTSGLGAGTGRDRTQFYAVVPAGALELGLWVESERMAFTLESFDEAGLELERKRLRNVLRIEHTIERAFDGHVTEAVYGPDHPYTRRTHELEELDHVGLSDARWFFQAGYRPDRAHLVVVGNFEPAAAKVMVERYFGAIRNPHAAPLVRPLLASPLRVARRVRFDAWSFENELLEVRPAPKAGTPEHVVAELLVRVLQHELVNALSDRLGLAATVSVRLVDDAAGSELRIAATPLEEVSSTTLEQALDREVSSVLAGDLRAKLGEAQAALRQRELERFEDPLSLARAHLDSIAYRGAPLDTATKLEALQAVTTAELQAFAVALAAQPRVVATLVRSGRDRSLGHEGRVTFSP